jgi:hypothetical protein
MSDHTPVGATDGPKGAELAAAEGTGSRAANVCVACHTDIATYQPDSCDCANSYCKKCAMKCATGGKCKKCSTFYSGFVCNAPDESPAAEDGGEPAAAAEAKGDDARGLCVVCHTDIATYQPDSCDCANSYCKKCAMKCATGGKCKKCSTFYSGFVCNAKE